MVDSEERMKARQYDEQNGGTQAASRDDVSVAVEIGPGSIYWYANCALLVFMPGSSPAVLTLDHLPFVLHSFQGDAACHQWHHPAQAISVAFLNKPRV